MISPEGCDTEVLLALSDPDTSTDDAQPAESGCGLPKLKA